MSKFNYVLQVRDGDAYPIDDDTSGWEDTKQFGSALWSAAMHEFEEGELACVKTGCSHEYRVIARIAPCANAPMEQVCQYGYGGYAETGERVGCEADAVADAPGNDGRWGYWCAEHLFERKPSLINVITAESLDLVMISTL